MRHFIIDITYTAPLERIEAAVAGHRQFLQLGYDRGWLLMSGPLNPRNGGLIIARAPDLDSLQTFFGEDPYQQQGLAKYQFREFVPVKFQPLLADWCAASSS